MSVVLVMGPAQSGKTTMIQQEIIERSRMNPEGRILYLVPEQMTLGAQQRLLKRHPEHGILNTEILSFNRLAHRIFTETGSIQQTILDDMGKSMILYKIVSDHRDELLYYGSAVRQKGFIGQLKVMLTELYQYRIGDPELQKLIDSQDEDSILYAKWKDIQTIYRYFEEYRAKEMLSSEQLLDVLAERIASSRLIAESQIYLDDFSGFTPQQYRVLEGLIRHAKEVTLCLSMTPEAWQAACSVNSWQELPMTVFYETQKTGLRLKTMAERGRIPYRIRWAEAAKPSVLQALRESLFLHGQSGWTKKQNQVFAECMERPAQETERLMHEILHLVREEGYRFREIAIVTGNLESYAHRLKRSLELYQIPYYIDQKFNVILNPYAQLVIQGLKMVWSGCAYEESFGFFKTGLTPLTREQVDVLENQAIQENWRGVNRYLQALRAHEDWPEAEQTAEALEAFFGESRRSRQTVRGRLQALRALVDTMQVREQMQKKSEFFRVQGQLLKAAEYERMPEMMDTIWTRTEEVMGDICLSSYEFSNVMDLGLQQCRMGMLPPSLDQLVVGELQRTRLHSVRVLFVIGFQDGIFPRTDRAAGLLNRKERDQSALVTELAPSVREDQMQQYLQLYTLLGKASERVYFSCCSGNSQGQLQTPALLWQRMMSRMKVNPWPNREMEVTLPQAYLTEHGIWLAPAAKDWYRANGYADCLEHLEQAQQESVPQEQLNPEIVQRLLNLQNRSCSVSQIEKYARCPFSYFLSYGLNLKEREKPQIRKLDDGNVLHAILEEAGAWFAKLWSDGVILEPDEQKAYIAELYENKKEEYHVYQTTGRYRYYWRKLQKTAAYAIELLSEQLRAGDFVPEAFEWSFGRGRMKPIEVPLAGGGSVRLQGKIDRIDVLRQGENAYLRIVDYKSSTSVGYQESAIYGGLQLQLPIYMEAAMERYEVRDTVRNKPAGIFYFHLTPELQTQEEALSEENKKRCLMKAGRMDGLLLQEPEIAKQMDRDIISDSKVLRIRMTRKGFFYQGSRVASEEQFAQLGRFAKKKIAQTAEAIGAGRIEAMPAQQEDRLSCDYCEFKGACRFDEKLSGARVRAIEHVKTDQFWQLIEDETETGEEMP